MVCAIHGFVMNIGTVAEPICGLCLFGALHRVEPTPTDDTDDHDGMSPMIGAE